MSLNGRPLSEIQKQILSNYRTLLRIARDKHPSVRHSIVTEMHDNAQSVSKRNSLKIEFLIRRMEKQIQLFGTAGFKKGGIRNVSGSEHDESLDDVGIKRWGQAANATVKPQRYTTT